MIYLVVQVSVRRGNEHFQNRSKEENSMVADITQIKITWIMLDSSGSNIQPIFFVSERDELEERVRGCLTTLFYFNLCAKLSNAWFNPDFG